MTSVLQGTKIVYFEDIEYLLQFLSDLHKNGTGAHFYMPNNMEPSESGSEHSDRRATGCPKLYILKI